MKIRIFIKQKCAQKKAAVIQGDFSDLNKAKEKNNNEIIHTNLKLVDKLEIKQKDSSSLKKFGKDAVLDLDSAMPYYLDEIEKPPQ